MDELLDLQIGRYTTEISSKVSNRSISIHVQIHYLLIINVFFTVAIFPVYIINSLIRYRNQQARHEIDSSENSRILKGLLFLQLALGLVVLISSWLLYFCFKRQKVSAPPVATNIIPPIQSSSSASINPTSNPLVIVDNQASGLKEQFSCFRALDPRKLPISTASLQAIMLLSSSAFFSVVLIRRTIAGVCDNHSGFVNDWNCNPFAGIPMFPLDTSLLLAFSPVILTVVMRERRLRLIRTTWTIAVVTFIGLAIRIRAFRVIPFLVVYVVISMMVIADSYHLQSTYIELVEKIEEKRNEEFIVPAREKALRNMIANVAHDLKTVC
jgi:hypothetical protein